MHSVSEIISTTWSRHHSLFDRRNSLQANTSAPIVVGSNGKHMFVAFACPVPTADIAEIIDAAFAIQAEAGPSKQCVGFCPTGED